MKSIKKIERIEYPTGSISDNFMFSSQTSAGLLTFTFKWLNDRWNLWVTFPDGEIRQASVYPNVISWSQFLDYGLMITSDLEQITHDDLFSKTELNLISWQD